MKELSSRVVDALGFHGRLNADDLLSMLGPALLADALNDLVDFGVVEGAGIFGLTTYGRELFNSRQVKLNGRW